MKSDPAPGGVPAPAKRVHITGAPRSGTTLLLALMLSCFEIDGGVPDELRLWRTPPKRRRIVCTKFPDETDFAAAMLSFDPNLHVIFLLRDPREVVSSRSHLLPDRYLTNLRVWRANFEAARPWFGHPRFHVVSYSELASDPDGVQARMMADMTFLRPRRPFSRFVEGVDDDGGWLATMHMKVRPVTPDRVGEWRAHLSRVKGQILIHGDISAELIELGFERDNSWMELLDGVRPDFRSSAAVERLNLSKRITRIWRNALGAFLYVVRLRTGLELSNRGERAASSALHSTANENLSPSPNAIADPQVRKFSVG